MTDKTKLCGTEADWLDGSWPDCFEPTITTDPDEMIVGHFSTGRVEDVIGYCMCREGAEVICTNVVCPRKLLQGKPFPIEVAVPPDADPGTVSFAYDLGKSMIGVGHGYDPYNHVGHDIVCRMLGGMTMAESSHTANNEENKK